MPRDAVPVAPPEELAIAKEKAKVGGGERERGDDEAKGEQWSQPRCQVVVVVAVVPARTEHQITDAGESRLNSKGVRRSNRAWRLRLLAGRIGPFRTSRIQSDASSHSWRFRGFFGACGVVVGTRGEDIRIYGILPVFRRRVGCGSGNHPARVYLV